MKRVAGLSAEIWPTCMSGLRILYGVETDSSRILARSIVSLTSDLLEAYVECRRLLSNFVY